MSKKAGRSLRVGLSTRSQQETTGIFDSGGWWERDNASTRPRSRILNGQQESSLTMYHRVMKET